MHWVMTSPTESAPKPRRRSLHEMEQAKNAKKEEHTRFVESLLVEMDGNKKKMIRDTLKTQVKVAGMPQQRHPRSARTDRSGNGISPTESKPLSVTSVRCSTFRQGTRERAADEFGCLGLQPLLPGVPAARADVRLH